MASFLCTVLYKTNLFKIFSQGRLIDVYVFHDAAFYFGGLMILISGLMLFAIPPIQRWMLNKEEKLEKIDAMA